MKLQLLILTLFISVLGFSQNKGTITGIITDKDANNQSLPFANVTLKGTKIGVNTDIDGKYSISATPGNYVIQFSFVGYETVEVPVTVKAKYDGEYAKNLSFKFDCKCFFGTFSKVLHHSGVVEGNQNK